MKIVFVGAVQFSLRCLEEVLRCGGNVVAVVTIPPDRSRRHADYADLGPLARAHAIPVIHTADINESSVVTHLRSLRPDLLFVFGFSQLIGPDVLSIPARGCIGTHPALLPRNRGRHPLIWTLVEGLKESGLTFFYLDEGADSGDILWQESFPVGLEDDAASLYAKITDLAMRAIREFLPQLERGAAPRRAQDDRLATYWRKRTEEDGQIHWHRDSMTIYNLIRALARPYVGAHTTLSGRRVNVWKAQLTDHARSGAPGEIVAVDARGVEVVTGDGVLRMVEVEPAEPGPLALQVGQQLGT